MNEIIPFTYEDSKVRVVEIDGEPWFVLADILTVLGISRKPSAVIERLDDGVRQTYPIQDSLGRTQDAHIVNEAGMYEVIIRSDSPAAKPFRRWVTSEVLPSIRKTGQYGATPQLSGPELYLAAITQATNEIEAQKERIAELEPKAARFDDYLGAKGDYTFTAAAKILQRDHHITIGGRKLIQNLIDWGWIYRSGKRGAILPYQKQLETNRLALRAKTYMDQNTGEMMAADPQTRVTPKGIHDLSLIHI